MAGLKLPFSQEIKTGQNNAFQQGSYLLTIFIFTPLAVGLHYVFTLFHMEFSIYRYSVRLFMVFIPKFVQHNVG